MAQLGLEYRLSLLIGEFEALDQYRFWLILGAHDANHFVEIQVRNQHAVEDVQPGAELRQPMVQAAAHGGFAKFQPFQQQFLQAHHARPSVEGDHVDVHPIIALEIGGCEQMSHERGDIHTIGFRHEHQSSRVLMIRLVAKILDHRQLLLLHLRANLFEHFASGHLEGQRVDHDFAILNFIGGARLEAAGTGVVHLHQLVAG